MKLKTVLGTAVLCVLTASLSAFSQKHPSVASGVPETSAKQLHSMLGQKGKVLVLDVRTPAEYERGHIPGAVNVPVENISTRIGEMHISKDMTIVTACDHGGRSSRAALELRKMGYQATTFCRIEDWQKDGYKIKK